MEIYIVKQGDSVDSIASSYGIAASTIIFENQLIPPYSLAIGQALLLNVGATITEKPVIYTNGYAYPYISPWVLAQTLPYLSELSIFSYGFDSTGNLIPPTPAEDWMIQAAIEYGVLPILTLTPLGPDGMFNNTLITSIVQNQQYKDNLISQVIHTVEIKGYSGVDVDFEYILESDKDAFTAFVADMADALHAIGQQISVALAPKTSADQPGLLYAGKDYGALGKIADHVLLMTYEWGYKYGNISYRLNCDTQYLYYRSYYHQTNSYVQTCSSI